MMLINFRHLLASIFLLTIVGSAAAAEPAGTGQKGVAGVEVSLLGTRKFPLEGFEFSLLGSLPSADLRGLQISGFFNHTNGSVTGLQIAGGLNHARDTLTGVQAAPINYAGRLLGLELGMINVADHLLGLQLGAMNVSLRAYGVQSGFFNHAERLAGLQAGMINLAFRFYGVQIGLLNIQANPASSAQGVPSSQNGTGLQVGLFNIAVDANAGQLGLFNWVQSQRSGVLPGTNRVRKTRTSSWLQVGIYNFSDNDTCLQIGLLNGTNRARCATIGLINIIRDGMVSATLWREPLAGTNFGFQFAGKNLYYILGAGNATPVYGCEGQGSTHLHFGGRLHWSRRWMLEADIGWSTFQAFHKKDERRAPAPKGIPDLDRLSLRVMARYRVFEVFSLYVGVGPGWIWDEKGISRGGFVPVVLGGVAADLPGYFW